ncbi:MAG: sortase [Ruminococcus sp.]|nr:sortase [Ruminococcus sp.]
MKKTVWKLLVVLGVVMLLSAGGLCVYNMRESSEAFRRSQEVLGELKDIIPEAPPPTEKPSEAVQPPSEDLFAPYEEATEAPPEPMGTVMVDGRYYCGYVTLSSLGIELPVTDSWSYEKLKYSPCLYSGTAEGRDMIIAAHNFNSHFGRIKELSQGDELWFTDVDGVRTRYVVSYTETVPGTDIEHMRDGGGKDWDLTLFTCTLNGQSRVAVRAVIDSGQGEA